jgi:hypothetical protein
MKWFLLWILLIVIVCLVTGCTALDNITEGNKSKVVCIGQETWGGKIVAEMVSSSQMLPNLTICFGKTNTVYSTIPALTDPNLIKAQAELVKANNSTISATATGITQSKQ